MNDLATRPARYSNEVHWMSRLLKPASIALVGASARSESIGRRARDILMQHGFGGGLFLVNPRYTEIDSTPCYPDLQSLPNVPDLVVMAAGSRSMESTLMDAINVGAGGMVVFANNYLNDDTHPPLLDRLKSLSREARFPVCGGNGMGFYNYDVDCLVSFDFPPPRRHGHIALVAHSGSVMTYLANTDPRLAFNLVVSPGQEINGSVADYMLFALAQPTTRVLALFIETVRDPERFALALETAKSSRIPVVLVKVGSTEKSARMAASHSGAIAGSDAAFDAMCDHYNVIRVAHIDQLAATALAFSTGRLPGPGGLSSLLDSGGLREQMIDLAESRGVEFTELGKESVHELEQVLEYGLVAENPVDAMGAINADVAETYTRCLEILDADPETAMLSVEFEFRDGFSQYPKLLDVVRNFRQNTDKPLVVVNSTVNATNAETAAELGDAGVPVINGVSLALNAIGNLFRYRDHPGFKPEGVGTFEPGLVDHWAQRMEGKPHLGEVESLELMVEGGLPVNPFCQVASEDESIQAARELGYPVVMKSAKPGLLHKSDAGGVALSLMDENQVASAYVDLSERLGKEVIVTPMLGGDVELAFGMVNDPQFGPVVMLSAGGVLVEWMDDRKFILAPFGEDEARFHIESLDVSRLLRGVRGRPACDIDAISAALARFSKLSYVLRGLVDEIDLNPVIASPEGCLLVDALVIPRRGS